LKKKALLFVILLSSFSCREEIIEPDNFVENVNDPVQIIDRNSYVLLLNASDLSMDLSVPVNFNSNRTRFNVTLIDYESGYISVVAQDFDNRKRFRYFLAAEVSYHSDLLDGYVLKTVNIQTENFTGKLRIEFNRTF
jgi:hypothetical protein